MVKAFILDLDGTLIESHDLHVASFKPLLDKYKLKINPGALKKYFGMSAEDILKKVFPELSDEKINYIVKEKRRLFLKYVKLVKKVDCADELLNRLSSKGFLAIASSAHITEIKAVINQLGWSKHFSLLLSSYEVPKPKPAPDLLFEVINRLRVSKKDCVFIGDSIYDSMAARSARMKFVAVTTGSFTKEQFKDLGVKHIYSSLCSMNQYYNYWKP